MVGTSLRLLVLLHVVLPVAVGGCQAPAPARTTLPAEWRNPELSAEPFRTLFVIGIGRSDEYRRLYEDSMVRALERQGVTAQASSELFPETGKLDQARVLVAVEQGGFDAVVLARLRSVHEEESYVPAAPLTSSDLYMSGYDEAYAVNSSPGHYETHERYRVETTLYSTRDDQLAWVVLSDTVNPHSVEDVIASVSERVAARMKEEGLIAP